MALAGMEMTRQAYAYMNWQQEIEDLDYEQLLDIPKFLPDDDDTGSEKKGPAPEPAA